MVPGVVDSIVVVGVLTHCVLLHSMCSLKATQINMQHSSLIWELMLYEFELHYNVTEATKNFSQLISRWLQKFCSGCLNVDNQARSGTSKKHEFLRQIQLGELGGEYQVSLGSHSPMWFLP